MESGKLPYFRWYQFNYFDFGKKNRFIAHTMSIYFGAAKRVAKRHLQRRRSPLAVEIVCTVVGHENSVGRLLL